MAVTNYYSVGGELLGEKAAGGQRLNYLTDALGSVTATVDQTGSVVNRYRYKPYGGLLSKSGVGADPSFHWVGSLGYRQTGKKYSDVYVRARHYDTANGRWTTKDPIGFDGGDWNLYKYARLSITTTTDDSGLWTRTNIRCAVGRNTVPGYLVCASTGTDQVDIASGGSQGKKLIALCDTFKYCPVGCGKSLDCVAINGSFYRQVGKDGTPYGDVRDCKGGLIHGDSFPGNARINVGNQYLSARSFDKPGGVQTTPAARTGIAVAGNKMCFVVFPASSGLSLKQLRACLQQHVPGAATYLLDGGGSSQLAESSKSHPCTKIVPGDGRNNSNYFVLCGKKS